jgi:hypothetical protein
MGDIAAEAGPGTAQMLQVMGRLTRGLAELTQVAVAIGNESQKAGETLRKLPEIADASGLAKQFESIGASTHSLSRSLATLEAAMSESTGTIHTRIKAMGDELARNVDDSGRAVSMLTGKLVDVANIIVTRTNNEGRK